jgi:aspartate/methionine/tyrosine aminotransferase
VHITAGCNQAFAAAVLALVAPGRRVALLSPCYFNHRTTLAMLGVDEVLVDCRAELGFVPTAVDIAAALDGSVDALVLVTPNNPTGAIYPPSLLQDIARLCRKRGVWLLLDETYRDFMPVAGVAPHALYCAADWRHHIVGLYSYSKSFCIPGHRLGALMGGAAVVEQVAKVMDNLQICAPRAAQRAVAQCLPGLADWREGNRQEIQRRAEAFRSALQQAPGWRIDAIGAYFAYVRHPVSGLGAAPLAQRLAIEAGVLTVPGSFFGTGQEGHLRMAFANADVGALRDLAGRLHQVEE